MKRVIVDCMGIVYAAHFAMKDNPLEYKGERTHIIYGFIEFILDMWNQFDLSEQGVNPNECFLFAWDSKKSKRKQLFDGYKDERIKKRREETEDERWARLDAYEQADLLRTEILPDMGFLNNFLWDGLEADDIIAQATKSNPNDEWIIVSSDHDLYQLITPNVSIWKKRKLYKYEDFRDEWGITPKQWADVKALGGCTSDTVPGIRGIAEKTACKYLKGELKESSKAYQSIVSDEGKEIFKRNWSLVALPFKNSPEIIINDEDKVYWHEWKDIFKFYGLKSFLKERDDEFKRMANTGTIPF